MLKKKESVMKTAVWIVAFVMCLAIWPYGIIDKTKTIQTGIEYDHLTEPLSGGVYAVQDFTASETELHSIVLILDRNHMESDAGILQVRLMDATDQVLQTVNIPVEEIQSYQNCEAVFDAKLVRGDNYRYAVEALETQGDGPKLVYRSKEKAGIAELGMLSYFGIAELPDAVSMVRLVYTVGLTGYQIVIYDAFILLIALLICGMYNNIVFRK